MLNRRLVRLARRLIPKFVLDQINPFDGLMLRSVKRFAARLPAGALVLDAGAGEAQYKPVFTRAGLRYMGIDLGVGEPDWKYSSIDVLANTEELPFVPGSFDGVLSIAVLEHSPRPRKVVHEMNAALKLGGRLLIVVPTMWEEHQMPNDFYRFTRFGISRLLEEAGFEVTEQAPIGGYFWFMGRDDDVINTGGHLVGPFEIESALLEHPAVAESAAIGKPDQQMMEVVKAFIALKPGFEPTRKLEMEIMNTIRKKLSPLAMPQSVEFVDKLPKTRSGKIMRRLLRAKERGEEIGDISTLEND